MITALAERLQTHVEELGRLERLRLRAQDVEDTRNAALEVRADAAKLAATYAVVVERLPELQGQAEPVVLSVLERLRESQAKFASEGRQVRALADLRLQVNRLSANITVSWRRAAEATLAPHRELLELVRHLPEIRAQEAELSAVLDALGRASVAAPTSPAALAQFDQLLGELASRLGRLEGLSPAVRSFLSRALAGTATVDDLTEEVWAWCRRDGHGAALRVSFGATGGAGR